MLEICTIPLVTFTSIWSARILTKTFTLGFVVREVVFCVQCQQGHAAIKSWSAHFRNSSHGRFGHSLLGIAGRWIEATRDSLSQPEIGQITVDCLEYWRQSSLLCGVGKYWTYARKGRVTVIESVCGLLFGSVEFISSLFETSPTKGSWAGCSVTAAILSTT